MAYTVLNARVKQKLATEADWLAIEAELGVIFEGEQAFVYNEAGQPVNFKIGDGTKLFSELPYFIAYYTGVTAQKILPYLLQTGNITISSVFKNLTLLQDIVFLNTGGSPITMNIGTTNGGSEIATVILPVGQTVIGLKKEFATATTLYFTGLTGTTFSMYILYYQLDEAPAIPPTGGTGSAVSFAYGTIYAFYPMYSGHENVVWDFGSGIGKSGTQYEGCLLMGSPGTDSFEDFYLKGYKIGDTIGGNIGANSYQLTTANIPKMKIEIPHNINNVNGGASIAFTKADDGNKYTAEVKAEDGSALSATPTPVDTFPKSKIVLFFTGPATT
jgi:hypothetical protein